MRKIAGLIAVTALAVASPAHATNGMRMIGFGPVQDSMGGVGVGATLDAASVLSNPAGIAGLGQRLDVGASWFKPTVSYNANGMAPMFASGSTLDSDRGGSPIPAIAWVRPLSDALSVGVGVFGVAGMGVDYKTDLYSSPTLTSYLNARLTPGAAYKLSDQLSVGVTANVMMAQMKYDVASTFGQAKHDTATAFGLGGTVGVKYSPVKPVTFGAAYETKSSFQDFSFNVPGGKDKLTFDQPQTATVGVAVTPIEMLLLAADVQWIDWSSTSGQELPKYSNDTTLTGAMPFNMHWKDQWVMKVGAQITPMKGLDLRAGYNYGKMPLDKDRAFENMAFPAVTEQHFTAGAGYQASEKIAFTVAGMYAPEAKLTGSNMAQGIATYTTKMSQFQVDLGATYRF